MAIATEINNLKTNISNAYTSIQTKGGTIPTNKNTQNLSSAIESISSGGDVSEYFNSTVKGGDNNLGGNNWTSVIKKLPALSLVNGSTSMNNMFYGFKGESLDLSNLDTGNVIYMDYLFAECSGLTSLDVSNFDTSKVTNMKMMFNRCSKLTSLNLSSFDFSKSKDFVSYFNECSSLTNIVFPNNMEENLVPTNISSMFRYCVNLTTIPLINASQITNVNNPFLGTNNLANFGGFKNLGQAYVTTQSANYYSYTLDMHYSYSLTEQSIINVLNNLYDIATKGCNTQQVVLGSTNLAKLTSEAGQQALANAQTKGWTVS